MGKIDVDMGINELVEGLSEPDPTTNIIDVELNEDTNTYEEPKRWQPKEWNVKYEKVVMYHLMGLKGVEIAEKMEMTPQHVYNILGCDQAIAIQKALLGRTKKETINITEEIKLIQELTVTKLRKSLEDKELFDKSPLGFIKAGIEVMKGTGEYLKNAPSASVTNNNNFVLPPSIADRFLQGLEKSDEARKLLVQGREVAVESD